MPDAGRPDISVVVPVYNELENLGPLVSQLGAALEPLGRPWEALLVNDGSTDGSTEEIDRLSAADPRVRGIHFARNCGQTAAFDAGFRRARGRIVITMDADLQNDPADIPKLLTRLDAPGGPDAVVGWRATRQDSLIRKLSSRIGNSVRNSLSGDSIRDTGCSLKAFRAETLTDLKLWRGMHRFLPTLLRMDGWTVEELPVSHRPRTAGVSKYGVMNRAWRGLMDLLAVRWMRDRRLGWTIARETPAEEPPR